MPFDLEDASVIPQPAKPIDMPLSIEPGLYFGMPEDEYHAIPALSASGIKRMMISSMDFWAGSWMNPDYQERETRELALGSGYGVRICEGKEAFYQRYAYAFDKSDYPEALDTVADLTEALKAFDRSPGKLKKAELAAALMELDPEAQIIDIVKDEYLAEHAGQEFLTATQIKEIEIAAYMIENDPEASKCFLGGYPEVTVVWRDPATGVPMKARMDYLKIKAIVDLKSFSNPLGKSLYNAIASAMASRKYHVQSATYFEADRYAIDFARRGKVFGDVDPQWLEAYANEPTERSFVFVFQQTGIAPVTRVREFSRVLETYKIAREVVREAQLRFAECWRHYGAAPWLDIKPLEQFGDEEFPAYILEI